MTFVGLNLHPGMGCTHFLPKIVGPQVAARMLLTGELVTGEQVGWQFNTALSKLQYSVFWMSCTLQLPLRQGSSCCQILYARCEDT